LDIAAFETCIGAEVELGFSRGTRQRLQSKRSNN
jgi:hypothetical protein